MINFGMPAQICRIFVLAAFLVAAIQTPTFAEITEPLEIVNETGETIMSLYAVPIQKNGWGNDLVGSGVMNQSDKRSINYDAAYRIYKIKVEFADGSSFTCKNVDLLDVWRLSLKRDGSYDTNTRG